MKPEIEKNPWGVPISELFSLARESRKKTSLPDERRSSKMAEDSRNQTPWQKEGSNQKKINRQAGHRFTINRSSDPWDFSDNGRSQIPKHS